MVVVGIPTGELAGTTDLVDVDAVDPVEQLEAVHEPVELVVPDPGAGTGDGVDDLRGPVIDLDVEIAVFAAGARIRTSVPFETVGGRVPEPPVDIGRDMESFGMDLGHLVRETGFRRNEIRIMGIIGMALPPVPVDAQTGAEEVRRGIGVREFLLVALDPDPSVALLEPGGQGAEPVGDLPVFPTPGEGVGNGLIPVNKSMFPSFRIESHIGRERETEHSVLRPSFRGRDRHREVERPVAVHIVVLADSFRILVSHKEGASGVIDHDELHRGGRGRILGTDLGGGQRILHAPAAGRNHLGLPGTAEGQFRELRLGDEPAFRLICFQLPEEAVRIVRKADDHPNRKGLSGIIVQQMPGKNQLADRSFTDFPGPCIPCVTGRKIEFFPIRTEAADQPGRRGGTLIRQGPAVHDQFIETEGFSAAEHGADLPVIENGRRSVRNRQGNVEIRKNEFTDQSVVQDGRISLRILGGERHEGRQETQGTEQEPETETFHG